MGSLSPKETPDCGRCQAAAEPNRLLLAIDEPRVRSLPAAPGSGAIPRILVDRGWPLCPGCADAFAETVQAVEQYEAQHGLRQPAGFLHVPGNMIKQTRWKGYHLEAIGQVLHAASIPPHILHGPRRPPLYFIDEPGRPPRVLLLWEQHVHRQDRAYHLRATWRPEYGPRQEFSVHGLRPGQSKVERAAMARASEFYEAVVKAARGRKPRSQDGMDEIRRTKVREANDLKAQSGMTWAQIAARLGVAAETLNSWRRLYPDAAPEPRKKY